MNHILFLFKANKVSKHGNTSSFSGLEDEDVVRKSSSRSPQEENFQDKDYMDKAKYHVDKIKKRKLFNWLLVTVKEIVIVYIDSFKDFLLVILILAVVKFSSLYNFPTEFSSVVVFCLMFFILFPMMFSSLNLAIECINESGDNLTS